MVKACTGTHEKEILSLVDTSIDPTHHPPSPFAQGALGRLPVAWAVIRALELSYGHFKFGNAGATVLEPRYHVACLLSYAIS